MTNRVDPVVEAEKRIALAARGREQQIHAALRSSEVVSRLARDGKTFQLPVIPGILSREQARRIQDGFDAITSGVRLLWTKAFEENLKELLAYVAYDPAMAFLFDGCGSDRWWRVSRPDLVLAHGTPWFVEMNYGAQIGGLHLFDSLADTFVAEDRSGLLTASSYAPLRRVAELIRRESGARPGKLRILVAEWRHFMIDADGRLTWPYQEFANGLRGHGIEAHCLALEEAAGLSRDDLAGYDLVYRFCEVPDPGDDAGAELLARLGAKLRRAGTPLLDTPQSEPLREKVMLAAVSDDRFRPFIGDELGAAIDAVVPWTRLLEERTSTDPHGMTVDLMPWVRQNREQLVLKPSRGAHGRDVLIGADCSTQTWLRRADEAVESRDRWLVQRFVDGDRARIATAGDEGRPMGFVERNAIYGAYFVDGVLSGVTRRNAIGESVSRVIAGEIGISPAFVV